MRKALLSAHFNISQSLFRSTGKILPRKKLSSIEIATNITIVSFPVVKKLIHIANLQRFCTILSSLNKGDVKSVLFEQVSQLATAIHQCTDIIVAILTDVSRYVGVGVFTFVDVRG